MVEMAKFIKPILGIVPPDLTGLDPRQFTPADRPPAGVPEAAREAAGGLRPAHDDERDRLPPPVVRDGPAHRDDVGVRDHRDVPGRPEPGHGLRPAPPLHGRDRRRLPGLGHPARRDRAASRTRSAPRPARSAPRSDSRRRSPGSTSGAAAPSASCSSRARRSARRTVLSSVDARLTYLGLIEPGTLEPDVRGGGPPVQVPRLVGQGQPGRRPAARLHLPARRGRAPARRDQLQRRRRRHGAGLRRRQVRPLVEAAVHRHDHPDPRRPVDGAARQARHQLLRPVRAVQPRPEPRDVGRQPRGVRRRGHRPDRRGRPEHPRHHPPSPGPHPARHRAPVRA